MIVVNNHNPVRTKESRAKNMCDQSCRCERSEAIQNDFQLQLPTGLLRYRSQ